MGKVMSVLCVLILSIRGNKLQSRLAELSSGNGKLLTSYTASQLPQRGGYELLNWTVLVGAMGTSRAEVMIYELCHGLAGIGAIALRIGS